MRDIVTRVERKACSVVRASTATTISATTTTGSVLQRSLTPVYLRKDTLFGGCYCISVLAPHEYGPRSPKGGILSSHAVPGVDRFLPYKHPGDPLGRLRMMLVTASKASLSDVSLASPVTGS